MANVTTELVIVALLIVLNGFFALAEMAIVTARRARLEHRANEGDARARAALKLANDPGQFLSTIQVGITLVGIFTGAFGGATISQVVSAQLRQVEPLAPYADVLSLGIVVLGITYLTIVIGELAPKRLALSSPERIALFVAGPMTALARLASPLVAVLNGSAEAILRLFGVRRPDDVPVTEDELKLLLAQGTQAGVFEAAEQDIVEAVFRLGDRRTSSLMTPRPEVVWLDLDDPLELSLRKVLESRHSHFPVCRAELDNVVGVATARDILARNAVGGLIDLSAIMRRPLFVPETLPGFRLLEVFRQQGAQFAIAVDEYGGTQGVVTLTDIFDAIVADIPTADHETRGLVQRDDGSWLVDGLLPLEELHEALPSEDLPGDDERDYYTIGGLMMSKLGRIPEAGDFFEWEGRRFEVVDMDGNRVDKVLISPLARAAEE